MFGQILGINSNNLLHCRACLCNNGTFLSIYDDNLAQIFHELTSIQVSENDFLPKELCSICAERLKDFRNFKELCLGSHRTLMNVIENDFEQELLEKTTTITVSSNDTDSTVSLSELNSYPNEVIVSHYDTEIVLPETNTTKECNYDEIQEVTCDSTKDEQKVKDFYYCAHCPKKFQRKLLLCKHLITKHSSENTSQVQELKKSTQKQLKCPYDSCNRYFFKQQLLDSHIKSHLGIYAEACSQCSKTFPDIRCLKQHLLTHSAIKKFRCQYCDKAFRAANILAIHENAVHTKAQSFICDLCGDTFYSRNNLVIHKINRHSDIRRYKCDQCPKAFKFRNQLKDHLIRHRRIKNVYCPDCPASFVIEKDLKIHQRLIHHRVYRFNCQECGKKYQVRSQLEAHMRVHTGERPFVCNYCGKGFQKKGTLKKHTYTHTGERPYKCVLCPKAYTELFILKKHIIQQHASLTILQQ